ncbi:molybdenum cofactor biosynthesis protein MoaE [Candidatus Endobugula sertula]|uniref:Molybdopterin synthase catalytic subunit n=1 Tax=Candidatus Endobugula sertula TaxID=62101 RepID=A0A1D2QTH6_9GAMM|nr:molybdenum cofactor biosynthesis protein MoaE [Candidatus Endobugula sertula]
MLVLTLDQITIQTEDFNVAQEHQCLLQDAPNIGAIVTFTGLVKEFTKDDNTSLFLEHYSTMTEKVLADIIQQAKQRWPIINSRIIHRIGHLQLGEQIVFVGANSPHRSDAFAACEFIIDFLKTEAPFWKKEITSEGESWVDAKESDRKTRERWYNFIESG